MNKIIGLWKNSKGNLCGTLNYSDIEEIYKTMNKNEKVYINIFKNKYKSKENKKPDCIGYFNKK